MSSLEAKARADLETSKRQLELEFDALKKQLDKQGFSTSNPSSVPESQIQLPTDSPNSKKENQRINLRSSGNRGGSVKGRDDLDPAKLSFKEKLGFWYVAFFSVIM